MINLYSWSTPNGRKVSILLEELGVKYNIAIDLEHNSKSHKNLGDIVLNCGIANSYVEGFSIEACLKKSRRLDVRH